ncbi:MAG: nucleoside triphosphate pyrophosphohydrolase [Gammaproteobacteria bacterium]|nr:MAG: nucleoside triphosphate pyrophosphohydrolase [Gammaproteobacteria bacterium]
MNTIDKLLEVMSRLRDPVRGCPWDREQDFTSIAPYTIEEAYEVADAIDRGNLADLRDELGDLLLQVVFHARLAEERGAFTFDDVVEGIVGKLVRRHPHVFGDERIESAAEQRTAWESVKAIERSGTSRRHHVLDGVAAALPALARAAKLGRRAAAVGFDWDDARGVTTKLREEMAELEASTQAGDATGMREEVGDLLFTTANLARHLDLDPEEALRLANRKFERRFGMVEQRVRDSGRKWQELTSADLDALWIDAKKAG